jgi:phosphoesterase RecJ-like protein
VAYLGGSFIYRVDGAISDLTMDFRRARRFLRENDRYLISTHVNADGDAIASALAMARIVKLLDRSCHVLIHDKEADPKYNFLEGFEKIKTYRSSSRVRFPASILVDTPNVSRAGDVARLITDKVRILNIDHHASNGRFGDINLVDEGACSTAELIFALARSLRLRIDAELATQLYTGIAFDTGRFRYSNLQRAFPAAASLLNLGADPATIAEAVYGKKSFQSVKALGQALASLELHLQGRVAMMVLPHSTVRLATDLDGIVDYAISISGVVVAALLKEQKPGQFRVSLRSRGVFDVNRLAREFEGGGHPNASGCSVVGDAVSVKKALLKAIRTRLNRSE